MGSRVFFRDNQVSMVSSIVFSVTDTTTRHSDRQIRLTAIGYALLLASCLHLPPSTGPKFNTLSDKIHSMINRQVPEINDPDFRSAIEDSMSLPATESLAQCIVQRYMSLALFGKVLARSPLHKLPNDKRGQHWLIHKIWQRTRPFFQRWVMLEIRDLRCLEKPLETLAIPFTSATVFGSWLKSPPLKEDLIKRISHLQLHTESRSHTHLDSVPLDSCWFEVAVMNGRDNDWEEPFHDLYDSHKSVLSHYIYPASPGEAWSDCGQIIDVKLHRALLKMEVSRQHVTSTPFNRH